MPANLAPIFNPSPYLGLALDEILLAGSTCIKPKAPLLEVEKDLHLVPSSVSFPSKAGSSLVPLAVKF